MFAIAPLLRAHFINLSYLIGIVLLLSPPSALFARLPLLPIVNEGVNIHFPSEEAKNWQKEERHPSKKGRIVEIWSKINEFNELERIVVVSTLYKTTEIPFLSKVVASTMLPIKLRRKSEYELIEQGESEAILRWSIGNKKVGCCKLILGKEALHSITYTYQGEHSAQADKEKWVDFLRFCKLRFLR